MHELPDGGDFPPPFILSIESVGCMGRYLNGYGMHAHDRLENDRSALAF